MVVSEHQTRRYLELIDELGRQYGKKRGWRSAVAERVGVHRSTLAKLLKGEREVTATLIDRACDALELDPRFFEADEGDRLEDWEIRGEVVSGGSEETHEAWHAAVSSARQLSALAIRQRDAEARAELTRLVEALSAVPLFSEFEAARTALEGESALDVLLASLKLILALGDSISAIVRSYPTLRPEIGLAEHASHFAGHQVTRRILSGKVPEVDDSDELREVEDYPRRYVNPRRNDD